MVYTLRLTTKCQERVIPAKAGIQFSFVESIAQSLHLRKELGSGLRRGDELSFMQIPAAQFH
jgi:hypothetical protein